MKALILSGGAGTRLRPLTHTNAKQLIPIANKPIIFYGIEAIARAGIKNLAIIVGDTAEDVMREVGDGSRWGIRITYIRQEAPLGLAHAVKISRDFMKDDPFIMYLGDNILKEDLNEFVNKFNNNKPNSLILLTKVPNPEHFGVAEIDKDGNVLKLVEKPKQPKSDLALVGVYLFDKNIFKAVNSIRPSARGELEITDAIQWLMDNGFKVEHHRVTGWWKDTGKPSDIIEANRLILEMAESKISGSIDEKTKVNGVIILGAGASITGSRINGPVVIGENVRIINSSIGPNVSIASNTVVENSSVENSIILEECKIINIKNPISQSILGRGVSIVCREGKKNVAILGDRSDIILAN
ncbi:MAG: glucose-1-phosphate thymidylyltransferase [Candidatus Saganbacteria bacterium]|nr:glucose-1-phosphate thymidylyltransferase [Candidatus Saganbacteria bacterium]